MDKFQIKSNVHNLNTSRKYDLNMPNYNPHEVSILFYTNIKLFNNLPPIIKFCIMI